MKDSLSQGNIKQYQGPFNIGDTIIFSNDYSYKLGISIGEDDYMSFPGINREQFESIPIEINGEQIQIGKTFIYEPGFPIYKQIPNVEEGTSFLKLKFPKGCPASTLIEIVAIEKPIE